MDKTPAATPHPLAEAVRQHPGDLATLTPEALLTPEQAAEELGLSVKSLSTWRSTGRHALPYIRVGARIRYRRADLDAWLASRQPPAHQHGSAGGGGMTQRKPRATKPSPSPVGPALSAASNVYHLQQSASTPPVFDPATTLIRMPDVLALTGLQRATVYKRLKDDPTFPRPVPLTASTARGAPVAFVLAEVQAWVRARIEARGAAA